jgi:hypothetical protein
LTREPNELYYVKDFLLCPITERQAEEVLMNVSPTMQLSIMATSLSATDRAVPHV